MTEATTRDSTRNPWLDVCRSSAILLVVLGHGIEYLKPLFPNTVQLFKFTGFIGVELFFVRRGRLAEMAPDILYAANDQDLAELRVIFGR
jgi:peptidoglycan/LPS O-acetylase OafA/YrhL